MHLGRYYITACERMFAVFPKRTFRRFAHFEAVYIRAYKLVPGWVVQMKAVRVRMSRHPTVPVFNFENGSKYYDDKTWMEEVRNIVEHKGVAVDFSNQSLSMGIPLSLGTSLAKVVNTSCSKERWIFGKDQ